MFLTSLLSCCLILNSQRSWCLRDLSKSGSLSISLPWKERFKGWLLTWAKWSYSTRSEKLGTSRKRKDLITYTHSYCCGRIETEENYKIKQQIKDVNWQRKTESPTSPSLDTTNGACSRKAQDIQTWERQLLCKCPLNDHDSHGPVLWALFSTHWPTSILEVLSFLNKLWLLLFLIMCLGPWNIRNWTLQHRLRSAPVKYSCRHKYKHGQSDNPYMYRHKPTDRDVLTGIYAHTFTLAHKYCHTYVHTHNLTCTDTHTCQTFIHSNTHIVYSLLDVHTHPFTH